MNVASSVNSNTEHETVRNDFAENFCESYIMGCSLFQMNHYLHAKSNLTCQ